MLVHVKDYLINVYQCTYKCLWKNLLNNMYNARRLVEDLAKHMARKCFFKNTPMFIFQVMHFISERVNQQVCIGARASFPIFIVW